MPETLYSFEGGDFTPDRREQFHAAVRRDFYAADCSFFNEREDLAVSNSRAFAGYIPISRHRAVGLKTVTRRTLQAVRANACDTFLLWFPVHGAVTLTQNGRAGTIESGNFGLSYSNDPLCVVTETDAEHEHLSFQITIPSHLVNAMIPEPKRLCAMPFSNSLGGARMSRDLFLSLYEEADHLNRVSAERLALSGLDILLQSIRGEGDEQGRSLTVREVKLQRLVDYLELNFTDSEITADKVAKDCGISTRYLHYLLKSKGTRFHDYLWQARLDNARRQLSDVKLARRSISEIAYATGFKSSAHFSRAFRTQFGQSPREMRNTMLREELSAEQAKFDDTNFDFGSSPLN